MADDYLVGRPFTQPAVELIEGSGTLDRILVDAVYSDVGGIESCSWIDENAFAPDLVAILEQHHPDLTDAAHVGIGRFDIHGDEPHDTDPVRWLLILRN